MSSPYKFITGSGALAAFSVASCLALAGCGSLPSLKTGAEVPRPEAVLDFPTLYGQNCSGCHGTKGVDGPSYPLANPEYQALVDEPTLHRVVADGVPGTLMPAFAISEGGTLTDSQIDAVVAGMRAAWWRPRTPAGPQPPPYHAAAQGNAAAGREVYAAYCASCHGASGQPNAASRPDRAGQQEQGKAGSITDPNFLALVSDQALRTVVIAGRPDIGQPDWKGDLPGGASGHTAMSDQQVTDVVAWLASQRPNANAGLGASAHNPPARNPVQEKPPHKFITGSKAQEKAQTIHKAAGGGF